ncbi:MAG: ribosome-binding factor A [Candidatus Thermofonsia Clade 1 bacterium]|jgi:ribosome-binding factor A|uniref:Ribosome-binding factor A n=1 Tax=Candidatus Thermofonsia Clade 1 bacterium TaxID=2364210 RepID=A0A2M8P0Y2_9CHLR|nr:MAG: ribosome-binding factor A [Candidatus Thermofonsia Clade 1 bacterium]
MTLKQERMADRIREILSELLLFEVSDPALQGLTVTEVVLDRELEYANVYVNALGEEERAESVMAGLRRAHGFLRRELASRIRLRRAPELRFHWDETLSRAAHIEEVLDSLNIPPAEPSETEKASEED